MIMSPMMMQLLLHVHTTPEPFPYPHTKTLRNMTHQLVVAGAIEADKATNDCPTSGYRTTPLGMAWIKVILRTPVPKVAYLDAKGDVVITTE